MQVSEGINESLSFGSLTYIFVSVTGSNNLAAFIESTVFIPLSTSGSYFLFCLMTK